jgi:TolA-binding protein
MAETADEFLELLARDNLVSDNILEKLRQKVGASKSPVSAKRLAKVLVDRGLLTSHQAVQLLQSQTKQSPANQQEDTELDLAPIEEDQKHPTSSSQKTQSEPPADEAKEYSSQKLDIEEQAAAEMTAAKADVFEAAADDPLDDDVLLMEGYEYEVADSGGTPPEDPLTQSSVSDANRRRKHPKQQFTIVTKRWDSPLLLVGGGALLLLVFLGTFLFFYLKRETAEAAFNLAEADYQNGSYGQAITRYKEYLEDYPKDVNVSKARVRIGMATIWREVEGGHDQASALKVAQKMLPTIEAEPQFAESARPELAGLLPTITGELAEQARTSSEIADKEQFVALHDESLELINNTNYIPSSLKQGQQRRLDEITAKVATVKRSINEDRELAKTIEAIQQAITADQPVDAYVARDALLKVYPALENRRELQQAVRDISQKEQQRVVVLDNPVQAETSDHPVAISSVTFASRTGDTLQGLSDQVLYFFASGAVYGLQADNGQLLWRRFVGHETMMHPQSSTLGPAGDALCVDSRRRELLSLAADTGKLRWRLPLENPLLEPLVLPNFIVAATRAGKLLQVAAGEGTTLRQADLPQALNVPPGADVKRGRLYVASEHSNLYVLASDTLECNEVYYLGHSFEGITAPPVSTLGFVFVVERLSLRNSQLHVLATDANGLQLQKAQDPIRLEGQVVRRPLIIGRRLLVSTDRGAMYLFEIDRAAESDPVSIMTTEVPTEAEPVTPYVLANGGQIWVASNSLTQFQLQTSRRRTVRKSVTHQGDVFVSPLQMKNNILFYARRRARKSGVTVTAMRPDRIGQRGELSEIAWETDLAVPPAGAPLSTENKALLFTAKGELYELGADNFNAGPDDEPDERPFAADIPALTQRYELGDGKQLLVSSSEPQQLVVYNPSLRSSRLQLLNLTFSRDQLDGTPLVFEGALLTRSKKGRISLLDAAKASDVVHPFQTTLHPGQEINWNRPALVHEAGNARIVISDGQGKIYKLRIQQGTSPHLTAIERTIEWSLTGSMAGTGDVVYGLVRQDEFDQVISFQISDLSPGNAWELNGRVVWGPLQSGDAVLAFTTTNELLCFTGEGQQKWKVRCGYGPPVGFPLVVEGDYIMASRGGQVWRIAGKTGKELGHLNIEEPLGTGPVRFGPENLLLTGHDGTVYTVATSKVKTSEVANTSNGNTN